MSIFKTKSKDKYKDKKRILKTMRVEKDTALKLDELQAVCSSETGETIPLNTILNGIINNFINDVEAVASQDENKATQKVLEVIGY